jgi:hypothetical protein
LPNPGGGAGAFGVPTGGGDDDGGGDDGGEDLKERRSPRERGRMGTSHDAVEGSRRSAPALPVEAVLGVIQRVLEP